MLTIKQIDAAKPKDKPYRLLDSNGLLQKPHGIELHNPHRNQLSLGLFLC